MEEKKIILDVKHLRVDFTTDQGTVQAVRDVSFSVKEGEILGIVGESGSGKSVTMYSVMGLLAQNGSINEGEIVFDGESIARKDFPDNRYYEKKMREIRGNTMAMIFQDPLSCLNPVFTVHQQMLNVVRAHRNIPKAEADKMINDMVRKVKLPDPERTIEKYPHELSGGQRQRIIIAMALLCGAEFLIADEPTRNLDVTIQAGILKLISELQKEFRVTVLFIANNLGLVSAVCDQAAILKDGEILEQVPAKRLLEDTREPYTRQLIDAITPDTGETHHNYNPSEIILDVKNLKKYFPVKNEFFSKKGLSVKAVDNVSLSIAKKETIGIVGESGCGKSTLVNTIMLLHKPTAGEVTMFGKDINHISGRELRELRKQVQIVFQDPFWSMDPRWLVKDIIGEPIKVHEKLSMDEYVSTVQEMAELVGLKKDDIFKYPHEFSGGQRQRIAIARALSVRPRLIILDEPTSAIDVMSQAQILKLLDELKESMELSYVIISHDLSVVNYMSDNIIVMYLGKIVEQGAAEKIFAEPKHPYTKALFNAIPDIHTTSIDELAIVKGEVPSAINPPKGCRFHPRCEFCTERCKQEEPQMHMVDGRMVGCFLYES